MAPLSARSCALRMVLANAASAASQQCGLTCDVVRSETTMQLCLSASVKPNQLSWPGSQTYNAART